METAEEDVRPVQLSLFRAAVEVLCVRILEVEADQADACGAEVIREEDRPISIREASEIPKASDRPGLCRRHRRPGEPRRPLSYRRSVVAMAMDHRDRYLGIRFHLNRHRPVHTGSQDGQTETFLQL